MISCLSACAATERPEKDRFGWYRKRTVEAQLYGYKYSYCLRNNNKNGRKFDAEDESRAVGGSVPGRTAGPDRRLAEGRLRRLWKKTN